MQAFSTLTSKVIPLDRANVDTDAIMPKQFLISVEKTGYGDFLFDEWRYLDRGDLGMDCSKRPLNKDFPLNKEKFQGGKILLARENFGCGSSREHAVWGISEYGIKCILAPSFADIFYNNCIKNGVLPVTLENEIISKLFDSIEDKNIILQVDLKSQTVSVLNEDKTAGETFSFNIEPANKERLLSGLDDIEITLKEKQTIKEYEVNRQKLEPWIFG